MDAGSCVSAPGSFPFGFGRRSGQLIEPARKQQQQQQEKNNPPNIIRSPSVAGTEVSSTKSSNKPRMAHLETLEAKMANIEVSLCNSVPRRRKSGCGGGGTGSVVSGGGGGGGGSVKSTPIAARCETSSPAKEIRSALQDREAVIQNLRVQLGLGKLPRPSGTPLDESERPAAEQKLHRLKVDAENKRIAIRNLKMALDKLDITDNIDVRIRQAELEYALGREELQLLSLVEEAQALQGRFDRSKTEHGTIFNTLQSGTNLALIAINTNVGRWAATTKTNGNGLWIEWALEGEGLYRGDRLLEVNGVLVCDKSREDLQRILGTSGKCQLVVLRVKVNSGQQQQLIQSQEDNMRLQHRISYLEEQVKEMQENKEIPVNNNNNSESQKSPHVTSINITSPPVTPPDKPEVYQRGNFVMTIVGGKPVKKSVLIPHSSSSASTASSASSVSSQRLSRGADSSSVNGGGGQGMGMAPPPKPMLMGNENQKRESPGGNNQQQQQRSLVHPQRQSQLMAPTSAGHHQNHQNHHHQQQQQNHSNNNNNNQMHSVSRSISASSISINSEMQRRERERKDRERELRREIRDRFIYKSRSGSRLDKSGDHLQLTSAMVADKRRDMLLEMSRRNAAHTINELSRSVKSLDFDSDYGGSCATEPRRTSRHSKDNILDYTSDSKKYMRPMPPKKPLRLSLQRAQSLQTVDGSLTDIESRKKGMKRTYRGDRPPPDLVQFVDSGSREILNGSASLGRMKYV